MNEQHSAESSNPVTFLPCPFCGSQPEHNAYVGGSGARSTCAWVGCEACGIRRELHCDSGLDSEKDKRFVLGAVAHWWNRRSPAVETSEHRSAPHCMTCKCFMDSCGTCGQKLPAVKAAAVACGNPVMMSPGWYGPCTKPDGHEGECERGAVKATAEPKIGDKVTLNWLPPMGGGREGWTVAAVPTMGITYRLTHPDGSDVMIGREGFALNGRVKP